MYLTHFALFTLSHFLKGTLSPANVSYGVRQIETGDDSNARGRDKLNGCRWTRFVCPFPIASCHITLL